ncbi:MAG: hypothetical protein ACFE94_18545 [Candidatus Hodarchaeota archaeon]
MSLSLFVQRGYEQIDFQAQSKFEKDVKTLPVYPPEKAKEVFESMPAKHQRLYTRDYKKRMQKQAEKEKTTV